MKFIPSRELRLRTASVLKRLKEEGEIIVTTNGKPASIMLPVDEENLEQMLSIIRSIKAKNAVRKMREIAEIRGIRNKDAEKEVALVRAEKTRQS